MGAMDFVGRSLFLKELVKGLALTGRHLFAQDHGAVSRRKTPQSPRFPRPARAAPLSQRRGRCIACKLCEAVCPAMAITIESDQRDDGSRRTTRVRHRPVQMHLLRLLRRPVHGR